MFGAESRAAHWLMPLALWLSMSLSVLPPAAAAESSGCAQNPAVTLERYRAALGADPRVAADMFRQVPSDLTVVPETGEYVVSAAVETRRLPLANAPVNGGLPAGTRLAAVCRVQGPAGEWWLASKARDGSFAYLPASLVHPAEDNFQRAAPEPPEKRSHDPLLQGKY